MSVFFRRELTAQQLLDERTSSRAGGAMTSISRDQALRLSVVWACLRLRADLESTMPVDVFRRIGGVQVEQVKPPVLVTPGGSSVLMSEHLYSSRVDLDSMGNAVGVIRAFDGAGRPSVIELAEASKVTLRKSKSGVTDWKIDGKVYQPSQVWHEKQFTVSGCPLGLSPIGYAALTANNAMSAMEFAAAWFGNSAVPAQHLRNKAKTLNDSQTAKVKRRFKESVKHGDVFVTGNDWELSLLAAKASESGFIEQGKFSQQDLCRFLGVPGDMIDVSPDGSTITYANITQRNLQFLIMNLGPAIFRREELYSARLLPAPRYMKLNPNALLRMDLKSRYESYKVGVEARFLPPSRILDLENQPPLTPEEEAEFARLFPTKVSPAPNGGNPS